MDNKIEIFEGEEAWHLLSDASFRKDWEALYEACPWATAFQSSAFTAVWFKCYKVHYSPVIVVRRTADASLDGLLMLALATFDSQLQVAGTHHAEYQAWLERNVATGEFLVDAILTIAKKFPGSRLMLRYTPGSAPVKSLLTSTLLAGRVVLKKHARPLWGITASGVATSLRKKSNKSRLNRLRRLGTLTLDRIRDADQFSDVLDIIVPYYDFRQGAKNDSCPFQDDPKKKEFHVQLLRDHPDLLHVTVMMISGVPVSLHIGIIDGNEIHLAIVAHSPMLAKHSLGKLHLLLLGEQLQAEGISVLDLTPGGDPWKERFATTHDCVYELEIHGSVGARRIQRQIVNVMSMVRSGLNVFGFTPADARNLGARVARLRIPSAAKKLRNTIFQHKEYRVYKYSGRLLPQSQTSQFSARVDSVSDLLLFEPIEGWQTKQSFLWEALRRLENGEHVYTYTKDNELLHYGWLIEEQECAHFSEVEQDYRYPSAGSVLYDFYTHPKARRRGLYRKMISKMLTDIGDTKDLSHVYISCLADNIPSRHIIEESGFVHICSLYLRRIFGKASISQSPVARG